MRTLSHFMDTVQEQSLREALAYYTQRGAMGMLLDARTDNLRESTFTVFEMEELMKKGDRNLIPVLLYIFHRIEKKRWMANQPSSFWMKPGSCWGTPFFAPRYGSG